MWLNLFPKVIKWCFSTLFLMLGILFLAMTKEGGTPGPIILALFSFGAVYWMYKSVSDIPKQVAFATVAIYGAGAAAAMYIPLDHFPLNTNFFIAWLCWSLMIGTPVIAFVYHKYD
ncbi:MAG: hypothetical protein CO093_10905 [Alphaproteobacteria bacterium CG_4_9_14_3_um_filter_47_13]|nr:MAG: hypothetical protein CO093_10905 [Alphaproteobacteria bacterium CG_4_9_14_3_um_filter_47_13]